MGNQNGVIMQYFEWYLNNTPHLWKLLKEDAKHLRSIGISAVWTPPAYKGAAGKHDVGYGVYDLYDLGEFYQKGSIETKYGTKEEFLEAIQALHAYDLQVYADIVINHKMGADETELINAAAINPKNRDELTREEELIEAWTKFTFPNRKDMYSSYHWSWNDFDGIDYNQKTKESRIFKFYGKEWEELVGAENANYDYLMGADIDFQNPAVVKEVIAWGKWLQDTTDIDGFRIDALKHIQFTFYKTWLDEQRAHHNQEMFAVGEYWSADLKDLIFYLETNQFRMSLFDVPLHYHFYEASTSNGNFDMSKLLDHTLVSYNACQAVTFVDNHDTQLGQALSSWVLDWFKPAAYAIILLREQGYPCIFYGDYYGIPHHQITPKQAYLDILLQLRQSHAYGAQHEYFDHYNIVGFTREGTQDHPDGLAVLITDSEAGEKRMYMGIQHASQVYIDALHNVTKDVIIDEQGCGIFYVNAGSTSIFIKK